MTESTTNCPNCGFYVGHDPLQCVHCGLFFAAAYAPKETRVPRRGHGRLIGLVVIAAVLLLAILAGRASRPPIAHVWKDSEPDPWEAQQKQDPFDKLRAFLSQCMKDQADPRIVGYRALPLTVDGINEAGRRCQALVGAAGQLNQLAQKPGWDEEVRKRDQALGLKYK